MTTYGEYGGENESIWAADAYVFGSNLYIEERDKIRTNGGYVDFASCVKFSNIIQSEEMVPVMKAMFDDGVKVIATKDGFEVDDYSHD